MNILKGSEPYGVYGKLAAAISVCVLVLVLCGAAGGAGSGILVTVLGEISACAALSLYAGLAVYAMGMEPPGDGLGYAEFIRRGGLAFAAVCATAQAVKLFFLLLPCAGGELVTRVVIIADALTSWIIPVKCLEKIRNIRR